MNTPSPITNEIFSDFLHSERKSYLKLFGESGGEVALHLGDLHPTHAHYNPLWVMAFDNFPLDAIRMKKESESLIT